MDDFSGLEYDQESISEEDVVSKTNNLLSQFNLPTQVTSVRDITASLFVVLYESLFSDRLPGIVRQPVTREDEISNCQTVIDVLSADVIKDNLTHIRGVDIVEGKVQAINNLLDIFTFLYEYVIKQIESDVPTDTDDDVRSFERLEAAVEDLETFLPRSAPQTDSQDKNAQEPRSNDARKEPKDQVGAPGGDAVSKLHPGGEGNGMAAAKLKSAAVTAPSPIPPVSTSLMGQQTIDSTADLIHEGEQLDRQFERERREGVSKTAWNKPLTDHQPGPFDFIGVRPAPISAAALGNKSASSLRPRAQQDAFLESAIPVTSSAMAREPYSSDSAAYVSRHPKQDILDLGPQNLSATEPIPREYRRSRSPGRMRATVGAIPVRNQQTPEKPYIEHGDSVMKGLSSSYESLHQMVQRTAALTKAAIDTSPLRRHRDRAAELDITDLSQERHQAPPSEGMKLAKELNRGGIAYPGPDPFSSGEPNQLEIYGRLTGSSPEKSTAERGSDTVSVPSRKGATATAYTIPPYTDYVRPAARDAAKTASKQQAGRQQSPHSEVKATQRHRERGDYLGSDREVETKQQTDRSEVEEDQGVARSRPLAAKEVKERRSRLSSRLHEMGKPVLASAQRRLETENKLFHQKQDFVKKLYEEEFGDAVDEVKGLLTKDRVLMKDMEEEYKKLMSMMAGSAPKKPKPAAKPKGFLLPKTKKSKTVRTSKSAQSAASSADTPKPRERPLSLADDEDLMPLLMEEFPHLYLSEHTWHELWRRGIRQIENLTRAYEENKRRKSRAQVQLEEAARKHEVLAGIVKKQLDHNHRMQQIKEQKKQQVMLNNKVHEKRSQSARARRYYNEYQVRARAKMMKRRSREEMIFKNLFKDGLAIQKERIQEVRRYAKEQRDKQAQKRQDEIDSLENFYRDQFEMLVEKLLKDKDDMTTREKAHHKVLEQMKRDLRNKMEKEIRDIQSQMFRDDDDVYLRQLEADRLRHELQHAKYQTRI